MPRSDRSLLVAAIFGLAVIFFGVGATLGGDWTGKAYEQSNKPYASAEVYRASDIANTFAAYPIEESNACYRAKNHDSADLCAQWRAAIAAEKAANAAIWSNRLSIIGAILSFFGLLLLLRSLRQTDEAVSAARDGNLIAEQIGIAQARAYIYIHEIILDFNPTACIFTARVGLRNTGSSPARKVKLEATVSFGHADSFAFFPSVEWMTSDIGAGETTLRPIEFHYSPISRDIVKDFGAAILRVIVSGQDVFNKEFAGAALGMSIPLNEEEKNQRWDWTNPHQIGFFQLATPAYDGETIERLRLLRYPFGLPDFAEGIPDAQTEPV